MELSILDGLVMRGDKIVIPPFGEVQSSNSEYKLITQKPSTGNYFETNLSRFGLVGLPLVAILDHFGTI